MESFLDVESCSASIGSFHQELHFFLYTGKRKAIYEDIMTKKSIRWFNFALGSLINLFCSQWLVFETTN